MTAIRSIQSTLLTLACLTLFSCSLLSNTSEQHHAAGEDTEPTEDCTTDDNCRLCALSGGSATCSGNSPEASCDQATIDVIPCPSDPDNGVILISRWS